MFNCESWFCLCKQLFPSPRSRTYQFDEFLQSWGDKLKVQAASGAGGGASTITVKLLQDVDRYAVCCTCRVSFLSYMYINMIFICHHSLSLSPSPLPLSSYSPYYPCSSMSEVKFFLRITGMSCFVCLACLEAPHWRNSPLVTSSKLLMQS